MSSYRRRLMLANQTEEKLCLYGNSVQDGTPAPEAPVDIMSVENPTIKVCGDNLFDNDYSHIKDVMYIPSSGVETTRMGYELNLPVGTYIMKAYLNPDATSNTAYIYACLVDKDRNYKQKLNLVEATYLPPQKAFNIEEGDTLIFYDEISSHTAEQAQNYFSRYDIMLNRGATALPYEPYKGESILLEGYILRGIGDYKDRIYTEDGRVWFEQQTGYCKTPLGINLYLNKENTKGIQMYTDKDLVSSIYAGGSSAKDGNNQGLSSHFLYDTEAYGAWNKTNVVAMIGPRIWMFSDYCETLNEWKGWFAENQIELVYSLATPIVTEITGALAKKLLSIDTTKNITISSENGVWGSVEVMEE